MLSLAGVSAGQAGDYYQKDDYYFSHENGGKGEVVLGRDRVGKDVLTRDDFLSLVRERVEENGKKLADARVADDLTFSAPKSVSLLAALGGDEVRSAVVSAHREAVQAVMEYIRDAGMIQARDAAGDPTAATGAVAVRFDHFLSRNGDPQLHSHVLLVNSVIRAEDGKNVSAYLREIYTNKEALGALYRHELAARLERLGYGVEWDRKGTFELRGFDRETLRAFSTRRREIEARLEEMGLEGGKAAELAAKDTRSAKKDVDPSVIKETWERTAREVGLRIPSPSPERELDPLERLTDPQDRALLAQAELEKAVKTAGFSLNHRVELALARALAKEGKTSSIAEIRALVREAREEIAKDYGGLRTIDTDRMGRERFTFENVLAAELRVRETGIREGLSGLDGERTGKILRAFNERLEREKGFRLSEEQLAAAHNVVSGDRDAVLLGRAGAGKTTLMSAIKEAYEAQGRNVIGVSPTGTAAKNLQAETGIRSFTVDSLAFASGKGKIPGADLIIVDEAGMLDANRAAAIMEVAKETGAKILWVGDPDQLKPVGHGDPFLHLLKEAREKGSYLELGKIHRQRDPAYREAVELAARGGTEESLSRFEKLGWVRQAGNRSEMIKEAVSGYLSRYREGASVLMVTERRTLAERLNREIRYHLKEAGLIEREGVTLRTRDTDGRELGEREFVKGDLVMFLRNSRALGVTNGMTGRVRELDPEKGILTVETEDGKTVSVNTSSYNYLSHGYAITVHKSQGKTVDHVIYVHDASRKGVTNANLYYVAVSRGRDGASIYTTDSGRLREDIREGAEKKDVLSWKYGLSGGRDLEGDISNLREGKEPSSALRNTVDLSAYPFFSARRDIETGVKHSAGRELWRDMKPEEKGRFVTGTLTGRDISELTDKADRALKRAGEWHPESSRPSGKSLFEFVDGKWKAKGEAYLRYGITRTFYYEALRNGDYLMASVWGRMAGLKNEWIRKDIGFSRFVRGEEKLDSGFALQYGLDTLARAKLYEAKQKGDLGEALKWAAFNLEAAQKEITEILNQKIDNFLKSLFSPGEREDGERKVIVREDDRSSEILRDEGRNEKARDKEDRDQRDRDSEVIRERSEREDEGRRPGPETEIEKAREERSPNRIEPGEERAGREMDQNDVPDRDSGRDSGEDRGETPDHGREQEAERGFSF